MYKSENDKFLKKGIAETGVLEINSNAYKTQLTINTDATTGTLTIRVKTRLSQSLEPLMRADGVTPVVIDLSSLERTIGTSFAIREWESVPSGLNGTFYELASSGAGNFE
jgi:hypothetical protein